MAVDPPRVVAHGVMRHPRVKGECPVPLPVRGLRTRKFQLVFKLYSCRSTLSA